MLVLIISIRNPLQVFKKAISLTAASTVCEATEFGGEFEFVCYARGGEMFYLRAGGEGWIEMDEHVEKCDRSFDQGAGS